MAELQIDTDIFSMLLQDDLAAFLSDTSVTSDTSVVEALDLVDWAFGTVPESPQGCGASAKTKPTSTRRTSRVRFRQQLQTARDEVVSLQRQLKILHENHELRESLDRMMNRSSGGSYQRSKFRALRERIRLEQTRERNNCLRQSVTANAEILEQVASTIHNQLDNTPKALSASPNFIGLREDDTFVLQSLRACLDARCYQLDSIVARFDPSSSALRGRVAQAPWPVSTSGHGIRMDFSESFAMPFSLELILDTLSRHTLLGAQVFADNLGYVDKITHTPVASHMYPRDTVASVSASEFERKQIVRRVVNARGVIILWEGSSYWQANESQDSERVLVRNSGWALIAPVAAESAEVSAVHYGCSVQMHPVDDSRLKVSDMLVNCVVRSLQSLDRSRNAYLENVLLDAYLERARCAS